MVVLVGAIVQMPRHWLIEFPVISSFGLVQELLQCSQYFMDNSKNVRGMSRVTFAYSSPKCYLPNLYHYLLKCPVLPSFPFESFPYLRLHFGTASQRGVRHPSLPTVTLSPLSHHSSYCHSTPLHPQSCSEVLAIFLWAPLVSSKLERANIHSLCSMEGK